jgi:methionine-gamma-lyase
MKQHSQNAMYLAKKFVEAGITIHYPGLPSNKGHETIKKMMDPQFGFGGMIAIDMRTAEQASKLMEKMEIEDVGYLAVSLGYFKTLFSNSGKSTSSEVPEEIQREMGLSEGMVRFSVGLDNDIERTWEKIYKSLKETGCI